MERVNPYDRDLKYYNNIDKVYWVPYSDIILEIKDVIKGNTKVPCIFVEKKKDGNMDILQFDMSIELDEWRYTAWRKVLDVKNNIRVGVLLIWDDKLFTIEGKAIDFNSLGRSNIWIDKNLLGKIDIKN